MGLGGKGWGFIFIPRVPGSYSRVIIVSSWNHLVGSKKRGIEKVRKEVMRLW